MTLEGAFKILTSVVTTKVTNYCVSTYVDDFIGRQTERQKTEKPILV